MEAERVNSWLADLYPKITRLEVIDAKGRSYTNWRVESIEESIQDEGRTLKLFVKERSNEQA